MANMKKILRYAVIGARHETECYLQLSSMEQNIDSAKSKMYSKLASSAFKDSRELASMLSQKSELWGDIEVR